MRAVRNAGCVALCLAARVAAADPVLHPGTPQLDPPTLTALGIALPITGDDNFTATVAVRYRVTGTMTWHDALPLQHVHSEVVTGLTVAPSFAGSIFDLAPGTSYDVELHATDSDGPVDMTLMLTAQTRAMPAAMPAHPRAVTATDAASLTAALAAAQPGDVITLTAGGYTGNFAIHASGTASDPIVIRGENEDLVMLDGGGCTGCNVLEVYGSFVHVETLTIQHATRALRFQTQAATDNVVRYLHIKDVQLAIGSQPDQQNFYIADNILEGRVMWPCVYTSDDPACNGSPVQHGLHANDDGIHVEGKGHVIAYNRISGFGDAMKVEQTGAVSIDWYGNDVLWTYDNGIELDTSLRNTRALRNRFTNTFATLSFQPIYGGPAYAMRNVLVNVADEQFKLHANGTTPTVGAVIAHNTIVRATRDIQCSTANAPLYFTVANNLFIGPAVLDPDGHAVRWDVPSVATATIDYNGFYPDGQFEYGYTAGTGVTYPNLAAASAAGTFDVHSLIVGAQVFADGSVGPADWTVQLPPSLPQLATSSPALDRATAMPNVDDDFTGAGPDLGALEAGCDPPSYGPRPVGVDETTQSFACHGGAAGGDGGLGGDGAGSGGTSSGCGCAGAPDAGGGAALVLALGLVLRRRRALAALAMCAACSSEKAQDPANARAYVDPDPYAGERADMVDRQLLGRGLDDHRVLDVMRYVPRHEFLEPAERDHAYEDRPLPIGFGSTISQPYIVALMTSAANVHPGDRALEIGTGSGYQAALLAELGAKVYSIEINDELAAHTKQVLARLGLSDIEIKIGDGFYGWPDAGPFDEILVTTAPPEPPPPLVAQLKIGGRMVIPVGEDAQMLEVVTRNPDGLATREMLEVRFSPMLGDGVRSTK